LETMARAPGVFRLALPALALRRVPPLLAKGAAGALSQQSRSAPWAALVAGVSAFGASVRVATASGIQAGYEGREEAIAGVVQAKVEQLRGWQRPSDAELRERGLSSRQIGVTRKDGTEPAFRNEYWDNHKAGIYLDIVSGEPLFASIDKFDSGTGWPSFTRTLPGVTLVTKTDYHMGFGRTEMRSPIADSHLGHIFSDGPRHRGGMRHCANSASLRFVLAEDMDAEGFGELRKLLFPDVQPRHTTPKADL